MIDDLTTDDDNELAGLNEKAFLAANKPLDARRRIEQMQEEKRLRDILEEEWPDNDA